MSHAVLWPLLAPLATCVACLLLTRRPALQRGASLIGGLAQAVAALWLLAAVDGPGAIAMHVGGWPPPYAITLVADRFSALLLLLPGLLGPLILLHAALAREEGHDHPLTHPLAHALFFGVSGALLAGDVFNLYVWFEVLLLSSFVLIGMRAERERMVGAIHYVVPNLFCSAMLLAAIGLLYGVTGTLDLARLRHILEASPHPTVAPISALFLVAFGIKAALFPFSGWLPHAYPAAPPWIAALFSALLTKVGLYAMFRMVLVVFPPAADGPDDVLLAIAMGSMVLGVLGAAAQTDHRRILAFHSVSQVGYVAFGLALGTPLALAGAVLFMLHHAVVKSNLFLLCGVASKASGSFDLRACGGLLRSSPRVAWLFGLGALSLAGLPPLSGFVAKLALVAAALELRHAPAAAVALAVSLITTFSMAKIWSEAYAKDRPADAVPTTDPPTTWRALLVPAVLTAVILAMGLGGGAALGAARRAADDLIAPASYVRAASEPAP